MNIKPRYHNLDAIKGICILFILITHYNWTDRERLFLLFPFWVDMAVPVFMIISGYVYTISYRKKNIITIRSMYGYQMIITKIVRYTLPFLLIYATELVVRIGLKGLELKDLLFDFLRGGGPRFLLLSDHASVYFYVPAYI